MELFIFAKAGIYSERQVFGETAELHCLFKASGSKSKYTIDWQPHS